ncbi:hypothetical protein ANTPLA_LOCUS10546 [Anthophora plagiata]
MTDKRDDTIIYDECADVLSDVPDDLIDLEEDNVYQKNESEAESSEDSEIPTRRIRRTLRLPTDSDESDEEDSAQWSDFDLPRTNNKFEGSPGPNIFPKDTQRVEDIVELYIGNDLFEYISNEINKYYSQNCNRRKLDKKNAKFVDVTAPELRKWFGLAILMEHKSLRFHDFLLKVSDSWIKDHVPASEQNLEVATTLRTSHHDPVDRLSGHIKQHQLSCGVALHLGDCFAAYHMKKKY